MWMDNYAGGNVTAFPSRPSPSLCNIFTMMASKKLNRLNGVSMNPSPISEIIISKKKKKKNV